MDPLPDAPSRNSNRKRRNPFEFCPRFSHGSRFNNCPSKGLILAVLDVFLDACQENILDTTEFDTRFDPCLQGNRALKISVTMRCGVLALSAKIQKQSQNYE
jgi:hypothetical protein